MKRFNSKVIGIAFIAVLFFACGEYNKILKSTDIDVKFAYAKKYFEEGKYGRAATLLGDVVQVSRSTARGEEALYLLAQSSYRMKDYVTASEYFRTYFFRGR